jgi:WD40 repeat protein
VAAAVWDFQLVQVLDVRAQHRVWARRIEGAGDTELSPDGRYLAVTTFENGGAVYDLKTGRMAYKLAGAGGDAATRAGMSVAWSPNGRFLAATTNHDTRIWDAATGTVTFDVGTSSPPVSSIAWSSDSTKLATGDATGTVKVWEVRSIGCSPADPLPHR